MKDVRSTVTGWLSHTTHTAAQIEARLAEAKDEHAEYAKLHGTHIPSEERAQLTGAQVYNFARELSELHRECAALTYELAAARQHEASPLKIGARVRILPPYDSTAPDNIGHDYVTGAEGTIVRHTADGEDVLVQLDRRSEEDYICHGRCEVLS